MDPRRHYYEEIAQYEEQNGLAGGIKKTPMRHSSMEHTYDTGEPFRHTRSSSFSPSFLLP